MDFMDNEQFVTIHLDLAFLVMDEIVMDEIDQRRI